MATASLILGIAGTLIGVGSLYFAWRVQQTAQSANKIAELALDGDKRTRGQMERAMLRAHLIVTGEQIKNRRPRVIVHNTGPGTAYAVNVTIPPREHEQNSVLKKDYAAKTLPRDELAPNESFYLVARPVAGELPHPVCHLTWKDEDETPRERTIPVQLKFHA
jgi:hypothetical protein